MNIYKWNLASEYVKNVAIFLDLLFYLLSNFGIDIVR